MEYESVLLKLLNYLDKKRKNSSVKFFIPIIWNKWGYKKGRETNNGELIVNPYDYFYELINSYILPNMNDKNYHLPYYNINQYQRNSSEYLGGDWIKESIVYSIMIRTSTSWDHDNNGDLEITNNEGIKEIGTFFKTLTLLPHLKKMGVDVLYLLPITKYSLKNKKGELGSPYSVSNFYELDPNLKDTLLGDEFSVEDEFKALVEASHILDMKVMIDIIPRSIAIENDLIMDHPEWFYWISCDEKAKYAPPTVPSLGSTVSPSPEVLDKIYQSEDVWKHIRKFRENPKKIDEKKYLELVSICKENNDISISDLIKKEFNIEIAPAFSDHINDPQPAWTDITFFRMYEDHPTLTKEELKKYHDDYENIPPYILFDTIKCNLYQGEKQNLELWEMLSGIIPYYQDKFGVDGARIDMGHALSRELLDMIITKARKNQPEFCFIAEELSSSNAKKARSLGYNMIIGDSFWHLVRVKEKRLHKYIYNTHKLDCPIFACGESHDTPRLASREGGRKLANMLTILNMFMPNAVPFINSGQEVYEKQPMNTGLDVQENALYMLDENDPFYKKLALFDKYALHYLNDDYDEIPLQLEKVAKIRRKYLKLITNKNNYYPLSFNNYNEDFIGYAYVDGQNILIILASTNFEEEVKVSIDKSSLPTFMVNKNLKQLFSQYHDEMIIEEDEKNITISLRSGEVKIITI